MNRRDFIGWLRKGTVVGAGASLLPLEQLLEFASPRRTYFDMRTPPKLYPAVKYGIQFVCGVSGNDERNGTSWGAAKRTIQEAMRTATPRSTIFVSSVCVYETSGVLRS